MYNLSQKCIDVELTLEEVTTSIEFIDRVHADKTHYGVTDRKFDKGNTSIGVSQLGHMGEMAVGKVLGLPVDMEVRTQGDNGHDLTLGSTNIQVKTSTMRHLIFNAKHLFASDVAILCQFVGADKSHPGDDPRFKVWGWVSKDEFLENYYNMDYGYGNRLVLDVTDLYRLDLLVAKSTLSYL